MPVTQIRSALRLAISLASLLLPTITIAQSAPPVDLTRWFQMGNSEVDNQANSAVTSQSLGMSDIILALDAGRKLKVAIDSAIATRAITEMTAASSQFETLKTKFKGRPIDRGTIEGYGAVKQYDALVVMITSNGYKAPGDWASYISLLQEIDKRVMSDLDFLMKPQSRMDVMKSVFFDLIAQKIILENIGAISGYITISMQ